MQVHWDLDQDFIESATQALRDFGAELLAEATRIVGDVPTEAEARRQALELIDPQRWDALNDAWYDGEPLAEVVERYISTHANEFFT